MDSGEVVVEEEVAALAARFFQANSGKASDQEVAELLTALQEQVSRPGIPLLLSVLWRQSRCWYLIKDHCEVSGLNFFPPDRVLPLVLQVLGDEEQKEEWRVDHPTPNVAEPGWVCFAAYSEFDYLFICMDTVAPHFGCVRRIVNNCWHDDPLPDMSAAQFIHQIELFLDAQSPENPDWPCGLEDYLMTRE